VKNRLVALSILALAIAMVTLAVACSSASPAPAPTAAPAKPAAAATTAPAAPAAAPTTAPAAPAAPTAAPKPAWAPERDIEFIVHSAAGGVGQIACQWAKHLGVNVIGTVGSDDKVSLARDNGCAHVLNPRKEDWVKRVREITNGAGVPVVYDSIGKDTFMGSLDCLSVRGMLVYFGNSSGAVPAFEPLTLAQKGSLFLTRPTLIHYMRDAQELKETADDLFAVIASGAVKVAVNQRFKLADVKAAHEALHSRQTTGATVLLP
jgi:NADPH2:quinone reductase